VAAMKREEARGLLAKVRKGCPDAFEQVHAAYAGAVRDFIAERDWSFRGQDLDSLVQEVFKRLWEHRDRFRAESSVKTYLLGIAKHVLHEKQRTRKRRMAVSLHDVEGILRGSAAEEPGPAMERAELAAAYERAKSKLTAKDREAFELVYREGLSVRDAAQEANCTPNQFSSRLYRALQKLRGLMRGAMLGLVAAASLVLQHICSEAWNALDL